MCSTEETNVIIQWQMYHGSVLIQFSVVVSILIQFTFSIIFDYIIEYYLSFKPQLITQDWYPISSFRVSRFCGC